MAYIGFKKLANKVGGAVAASIGRKKYGKKKFQEAAAKGKKLKGASPAKKTDMATKKKKAPAKTYASGKMTRSGKMMAKAKVNSKKKKSPMKKGTPMMKKKKK